MFICSKSLKSSKCLKRSKSKDGSTKRSPIGILVLLSWRLHPNRWCEIAAYKTHVQTDRGNKNLRANKIVITIMMMVASSLSVGRLRFTIECSLIRTMSTTSFFKYVLIPASFTFIFVLFTSLFNYKLKKLRWCAWDLHPEPQDGRRRQNHGAMATALQKQVLA